MRATAQPFLMWKNQQYATARMTFDRAATILMADRKQLDQPTASNCSGLVPSPFIPGTVSLTSSRPSDVREDPPSRPPVVCALAV